MNPLLTMLRPAATGWLRPATPARRLAHACRTSCSTRRMLYRSECFAEDLQAASDAALADLFPMLRTRRTAAAR